MFQRNPNRSIFIIILVARLCYAFWSWIKPSLILPSHAINYTKKHILIISKFLIVISSALLPLNLSIIIQQGGFAPTPVILVIDQSRSMSHNDLTPSRWIITQDIVAQLLSDIRQLPRYQLITYSQIPKLRDQADYIFNISPIATQQGSSALGDARLIAYDQIGSGLDYKPIVITVTDGGSNTGYDLSQTSQILKTRAQLWIIGLSTGTQIVAYDDEGRGLTSTMNAALLSSLADSGHRYSIPDDASVDGTIDTLGQDLHSQYYNPGPITFEIGSILRILLGLGVVGWGGIYLIKKN